MKYKLCKECNQSIKPGRHKPDEYEHAQGCPLDRSKNNPAAVALGKLGGKVKSAAKAAAARKNGKKGGRPKLSSIGRGK